MHIVFANTGVQIVCQGLNHKAKGAFSVGWQKCECLEPDGSAIHLRYVQWQLVNGERLLFAVDTTCGDPEKGFFCSPEALAGDFRVPLGQLLGTDGKPIPQLPQVNILIRPATASGGEPIPVHMVVDFGNSRTGALLIESDPESGVMPLMDPFELVNRHQLDAWDENGEYHKRPARRWFNSRTQWCYAPYLRPERIEMKTYDRAGGRGAGGILGFGRRPEPGPVTVFVNPRLFQDLSAVRMGPEVDDITQIMRAEADVRTAVSSPKRYLWAADDSWLGGAIWHMADPCSRCSTDTHSSVLQGPFFRMLAERDPDELDLPDANSDEISDEELSRERPLQPRHAPRVLMVAAIYELLCQAYTHMNSIGHRQLIGDKGQPRELVSLSLTFPSGMIVQERERFRLQAQKAVDMFHATLGRSQAVKPTVAMSIDEASAVHLTYIWSELQTLEKKAGLWFSLMGKPRSKPAPSVAASGSGTARPPDTGRTRPTAPARTVAAAEVEPAPEVRIGCIDIGGGTSDLMIARYTFEPSHVYVIQGEMLHRDGISLAGDQLVKRLIEKLIIPEFADCVNMGRDDVMLLFGQEVPTLNRRYRQERIQWMNRLFVPLAQAYLQAAVEQDTQTVISHMHGGFVDGDIVESLQDTINLHFGAGHCSVTQDLGLRYDPEFFDNLVYEVFNELLVDFCDRLVKYDVDVVLLAGQPTKLRQIQQLVQEYLPLPSSRVIPLHNHYAGSWYPYQDAQGREPGVIVDPKSAVVVGAAVEFLMSRGKLGMMQFNLPSILDQTPSPENDYYWGILTEGTSKIENARLLFTPLKSGERPLPVERTEFKVVAEQVLIGRRLSPSEHGEASPVWGLKIDRGWRDGPIDLIVTLERRRADLLKKRPETLELVDVKGTVAGEPADMQDGPGRNVFFDWRTLANDSYFLDTGALDSIEM